MRKILVAFLSLIFFADVASAEENLDFGTARTDVICALTSMAAYSGDTNFFTRDILTARGWDIFGLKTQNSRANVKAYLIGRNLDDGGKMKILVIAGTEDLKDVEVDFRVGRVGLLEDEVGADKIFVHRGFRDYTDAALSGGVKEYLLEEMEKNPEEILYITGHSLGGAVALMTAVRLCDAGADMSRIKVVTFGAPALGNRNFADAYKDKINLRRIAISGDVIKKSLQVLGYVQFGNFVEYKAKESENHYSHSMALYLECALKNYYDVGGFEKLVDFDEKNKIDTPIYVAPIKVLKKSFSAEDEKYILSLLTDGLRSRLTNLTFAEPRFVTVNKAEQFSYDAKEFLKSAREENCKFILIQNLRAKTVKETRQRETRVTLDEMIFDSEGRLISMQTAGPTTKDLTIIETAAFAQENLRYNREKIFKGEQ